MANINNGDFSLTVVGQSVEEPASRDTRTCTVLAGYGNVININGGTFTSKNSRATFASFSSGAVYNIANGAVVKAEADAGIAIGYVIAEDIASGTNG